MVLKRQTLLSGLCAFTKTLEFNPNGTIKSIEMAKKDGTPYNRKELEYREANPYQVRTIRFEVFKDGNLIQRRTAIFQNENNRVIEKNEFFKIIDGKCYEDITCECSYEDAYLDKFGEVREYATKRLVS